MRVRAPGSIANMGPGFDCMAMAIDLWLEVEAVPVRFTRVRPGASLLAS